MLYIAALCVLVLCAGCDVAGRASHVAENHSDGDPSQRPSQMTNSIGMTFALIPAGEFTMGILDAGDTAGNYPEPESDGPHRVRFERPFYIGVCEVTQAQYAAVMGTNPSWHNSAERLQSDVYRLIFSNWLDTLESESPVRAAGFLQSDGLYQYDAATFPVEMVTWYDAASFCEVLSEFPEEKSAGRRYRLPTEAEWEYACREGRSEAYVFTFARSIQDISGENANKLVNGAFPIGPVGLFSANRWGLFDMRGNVSEWCADWYSRDYYARSPTVNPPGPADGFLKVIRASDSKYVGENCKISGDLAGHLGR